MGNNNFNFLHAVWIENESSKKSFDEVLKVLSAYGIRIEERDRGIYSCYEKNSRYPILEVGHAKDNIILCEMEGQWDLDSNFRKKMMLDIKNLFKIVEKYKPFFVIKGNHSCRINCDECCDCDPLGRVVRQYCEYFVFGSYCAFDLAGEEKPEHCKNYWCYELREPYSVRTDDGPFGLRPRIKKMREYSKEEKQIMKGILENIEKLTAEEIAKKFPRYQEVKMYKEIEKLGTTNSKELDEELKKWRECYLKRKKKR